MKPNHRHNLRKPAISRMLPFLITAVVIIMPQVSFSQRSEFGVTFGGAFYMGDLNPKLPMVMVNPAGGLLYRQNFNDHLSLRANVLYMRVEGNDKRLATYYPERDFGFFSDIYEFSFQAEVNFLPFEAGNLKTPFSPYVFAGAGGFIFHPKRLMSNGQIISLYDIAQNPTREVESLGSYSFLFGLGLKVNVTRNISTGMEWGMRRTGTDHLDDLSIGKPDPDGIIRVGNPKTNDWYSYFGLIMTFKINDPTRARCPY